MCGIAGVLMRDGRPAEEPLVRAMTARLAHRGPDGDGVHVDGPVGLGHRRLAIIDLESGRQPLSNEDGTVWITFNGEIYNFRSLRVRLEKLGHTFRTHSDTEAIVHAYEQWGVNCLSQLRGMFAFAIWDGRRRQLFLARDRLGIKPLVYARTRAGLVFASELQALDSVPDVPRDISLRAVDLFLHYQYIPAPHTIYEGVHKLPPAHYLLVSPDQEALTPKPYWKVAFEPDRTLSEDAWTERMSAKLDETVAAHLVSDVPFGAFLSGGVDSSTVVASMSRVLKQPVQAFCIGHPQAEFDERQWAEEAARVCGAEFHVETIEPRALEILPRLVRHYGEPFADSSALPTYYVSQLARRHVKMVLSGDGGDELFAGYHAYPAILWQHRPHPSVLRRARHALANQARALGLWPQAVLPEDNKYRRTAAMPADLRRRLWKPEFRMLPAETRAQFARQYQAAQQSELLNHLQCFDVENYIPFDNLTKVDVASMLHGLEVRVPLLDHEFVETAAQVPPEFKLRRADGARTDDDWLPPGGPVTGKLLLKRVAGRTFSDEFLHRPKRGFEVPIQHWFGQECGPVLQERVLDRGSPMADWFEADVLREVVSGAASDKLTSWRAWSLLILGEWLQQRPRTPAAAPPPAAAVV